MIDFGSLGKTKVRIGIGGGRWIEVPMLKLADFQEFERITVELGRLGADKSVPDSAKVEAILSSRGKLAGLACKVCPVELHENLRRMEMGDLVKLVSVLCTGKDEAGDEENKKKIAFPSQMGQE